LVLLTLAVGACARDDATIEPGAQRTPPTQSAPTTARSEKAETKPQGTTVRMKALNDSGQSGTATLTAVDSTKTKVQVELSNSPAGLQPAHIHSGTCSNLGSVEYALASVENGKSESTVDVSVTDLLAGQFAINVHKSAAEANVYISCGEIAT
jgi:Cu/Zn superoxide dismutase